MGVVYRKFHAKLLGSPSKHKLYLEKERKRWHDRKIANKVNSISDFGEREQCRKWHCWAELKRVTAEKSEMLPSRALTFPAVSPSTASLPTTPTITNPGEPFVQAE